MSKTNAEIIIPDNILEEAYVFCKERAFVKADVPRMLCEFAMQKMKIDRRDEGDIVAELFTKPYRELKPLEDMWRAENSPDKFVLPDMIEFFKWIVKKLIK